MAREAVGHPPTVMKRAGRYPPTLKRTSPLAVSRVADGPTANSVLTARVCFFRVEFLPSQAKEPSGL